MTTKNTYTEEGSWRRYADGLYTTREAKRLMQQLPDGAAVDQLMEQVWDEAALEQRPTDLAREKYKREARQLLRRVEHKKRLWARRVMLWAASAAACVALVVGSVKYVHYLTEQEVTYLTASASHGEHKQVLLPDGTRLMLNSCSQVRYPSKFVGEERRVQLEGEAYFEVARSEGQPFVVGAHCFSVRVLGTQFNVKAYAADELASVEVESGKVQVDMPEAMMRLGANEQVLLNHRSGECNKLREARTVAVWKRGVLHFRRTPIRDVAKELERVYNCRITFADGCEFDNLISGEHDNSSLEAVLQSIEYTSGIHYTISGSDVRLFK